MRNNFSISAGALFMNRTLRIVSLIRKEKAKQVNFHRLATAINIANNVAKTGYRVNHQTLKKIAEAPESIGLRLGTIRALDTYFSTIGHSLADKPLLEKLGIIESLVEARSMTFLLGSRPRRAERRHDLSRWDTRSLAEILSESCKFDVHVKYNIADVLLRPAINADLAKKERWHDLLADEDRSLISIGSPLACLASEVMLARMFGVTPFQTPDLSLADRQRLPFYYAWPPKRTRKFRSAFALDVRQLEKFDRRKAQALHNNRIAAFVLGSEVLPVKMEGKQWEMYGVVAAQRRGKQSVWLVVSGLSGPATYGAAVFTKEIMAELPWKNGHAAPVLWVPVKASIVADKALGDIGDNREMLKVEALTPPQTWPPG
jgi:hypothetical protein